MRFSNFHQKLGFFDNSEINFSEKIYFYLNQKKKQIKNYFNKKIFSWKIFIKINKNEAFIAVIIAV